MVEYIHNKQKTMIIVDYSGIAIAAIFSQDRPEEIEESPTTTVLTTPFVPIPAEGLKSNFIFEPERYAV